jgi:hypothetical protein
MQHQEVIHLVKDFFDGKRLFILPSSSLSDYESFSDWEIGVKRHNEMYDILCLLREYARSIHLETQEIPNGQDLTPEQKSALVHSWIQKYKIQRFVIMGEDTTFT